MDEQCTAPDQSQEIDENRIEKASVLEGVESSSLRVAKTRRFGISPLALVVLGLLLATAALVWWAVREAGKMPGFYQSVLEIDPARAAVNGSQLEQNLVRLQNAAMTSNPWRVELTQQQINGWLVSDLPEKFPGALPQQVQDPRVVIDDNELKLTFKYVTDRMTGFVVVTADIFCTDVDNEVAVKVVDVRSGFIPLPIAPWVQQVTEVIQSMGVPVYWTSEDDTPVAIFTIPEFLTPQGGTRNAIVDSISLKEEKIVVAGKTRETVEEVAQAIDDSGQR